MGAVKNFIINTVDECVGRVNVETKELGWDLSEALVEEVISDDRGDTYNLESLRADVMDRLYDLGYGLTVASLNQLRRERFITDNLRFAIML